MCVARVRHIELYLPYAGVCRVKTDATYDAGAGVKSSVVNRLEVYIVSEAQYHTKEIF